MDVANVGELAGGHSPYQAVDVERVFETIQNSKPRVIYFPAGVYKVHKRLRILAETCVVYGDGMDATLIDATGSDLLAGSGANDPAYVMTADRGEWKDIPVVLAAVPKRFDRSLRFMATIPPELCQVGDALLLRHPNPRSYADFDQRAHPDVVWCAQSRELYAGEMLIVSGFEQGRTEVKIAGTVQGNYENFGTEPVAVRVCRNKVNSFTLRELTILGTGKPCATSGYTEYALQVSNGKNVAIDRIRLDGSYKTLLDLQNCLGAVVRGHTAINQAATP